MLVTGNQLKAARALAGVDQLWAAQAANIAVNTVRNMEACGDQPITSSAANVRGVQRALELLGVEFTNGDSAGVRLHFLEALPHQRENGDPAILVRWREGPHFKIVDLAEATRIAETVERKGQTRISIAIREAIKRAKDI